MFDGVMKKRKEFKNIDGEISYINEMLKSATDYGGDAGGPYCTDPEELESKINDWLVYTKKSDDFEAYIVKELFSPSYVQIRPIPKEIPEISVENSIGYYGMTGGRGIFAIMMVNAQMMNNLSAEIVETADNVARGNISSNLTTEQLHEINDELNKANKMYEKALCEIVLSTNNSNKAIDYFEGTRFRFNECNHAYYYLKQFTDYLFAGKSVTVAGAYRLYGVSNYNINDEKRGWIGDVKVTIEPSVTEDGTFYYVVIHDDPIDLC